MNRIIGLSPEQQAELKREGKLRDDPRVTRLGYFLRRTSIDELPQLYNVLRGDMSMVGPRPITEQELERYGDNAQYYLSVRPGITGLWQVSGRSTLNYDQRIELDTRYVMERSFMGDVRILLRTIVIVLTGRGAY
jgi:undecaprenyl-phosphate galactose phosphotransferase